MCGARRASSRQHDAIKQENLRQPFEKPRQRLWLCQPETWRSKAQRFDHQNYSHHTVQHVTVYFRDIFLFLGEKSNVTSNKLLRVFLRCAPPIDKTPWGQLAQSSLFAGNSTESLQWIWFCFAYNNTVKMFGGFNWPSFFNWHFFCAEMHVMRRYGGLYCSLMCINILDYANKPLDH